MARPEFHRLADRELNEAAQYYDLENPGLVQGLRALGYVEGKNLVLTWRSAEGRYDRFPEMIRELLPLKVDVLSGIMMSVGSTSQV